MCPSVPTFSYQQTMALYLSIPMKAVEIIIQSLIRLPSITDDLNTHDDENYLTKTN